jgi:hypothetical protein
MVREIDHLRSLALDCSQLAKKCRDKQIADKLEGISVELAEIAKTLDTALDLIDKPTLSNGAPPAS